MTTTIFPLASLAGLPLFLTGTATVGACLKEIDLQTIIFLRLQSGLAMILHPRPLGDEQAGGTSATLATSAGLLDASIWIAFMAVPWMGEIRLPGCHPRRETSP